MLGQGGAKAVVDGSHDVEYALCCTRTVTHCLHWSCLFPNGHAVPDMDYCSQCRRYANIVENIPVSMPIPTT